jgi:hypothetical protein
VPESCGKTPQFHKRKTKALPMFRAIRRRFVTEYAQNSSPEVDLPSSRRRCYIPQPALIGLFSNYVPSAPPSHPPSVVTIVQRAERRSQRMSKKQVVSAKKSHGLTMDHVTRPKVPELVQRNLLSVGMKVFIPYATYC